MHDLIWVGHKPQVRALSTAIEIDLGRKVEAAIDAVKGLAKITQTEYPLILVNHPVPVGNLEAELSTGVPTTPVA